MNVSSNVARIARITVTVFFCGVWILKGIEQRLLRCTIGRTACYYPTGSDNCVGLQIVGSGPEQLATIATVVAGLVTIGVLAYLGLSL